MNEEVQLLEYDDSKEVLASEMAVQEFFYFFLITGILYT